MHGAGLSCTMFFHPHSDVFQLFLVGDLLRSGIISGSKAAQKYKRLQTEKDNKKNDHVYASSIYLFLIYVLVLAFIRMLYIKFIKRWE